MKKIMKNLSKAIIIIILLSSQSLFSKNAENAITIQPLGILTIRTNIEYERYISKVGDFAFSLSGRFNISTQKLGASKSFNVYQNNFPTTWIGYGVSSRFYLGKEMDAFYFGVNLDNLSGTYQSYDITYPTYVYKTSDITISWMGIEIGKKFVISGKHSGFIITPSVAFLFPITFISPDVNKIIGPLFSVGVATGYQF